MLFFCCTCLFLIAVAVVVAMLWLCYVLLYLAVCAIAYLCGLFSDKAWIPIVLLIVLLISMLL